MTTLLDVFADALHATAAYNPAAEAPPEAVVWCDASGDFAPILPVLRARMPGLLTFGTYDPAMRTGPALWLRAAAARQVVGVEWPAGEPPVIYVPYHGRDVLRGAEDCPADLAPLVWFAVAGSFFGQSRQARDWTLRGFLAAQGSPVGLDVPEDAITRVALARAASRLFGEPVATVKARRWDAAALDGLLVENPVADMLAWMDGALMPEADPARFEAFAALAAKQFGFDPRKKTRQDAAARLVRKEKAWAKVWDRFAEAGGGYEEVVRLLGCEEPQIRPAICSRRLSSRERPPGGCTADHLAGPEGQSASGGSQGGAGHGRRSCMATRHGVGQTWRGEASTGARAPCSAG
jgi:hypothetical protein